MKKSKKKNIQDEQLNLSEPIKAEVLQFLEFYHAGRLGRNLRNLLLEFLMFEGAPEAVYLKHLLYDLRGLYDLLDAMESEQKGKIEDP